MEENAIYLSPLFYDLLLSKLKEKKVQPTIEFQNQHVPIYRHHIMEGYSIHATGNIAEALFYAFFNIEKP